MNQEFKLSDEPPHRGGKGYFEKVIGVTDNVGYFGFAPAVSRLNTDDDRCDRNTSWGPVSFHKVEDGVCNCGYLDQDESTEISCQIGYADPSGIDFAAPVISRAPIGYVCYAEHHDQSIENLFCRQHWNSNARTLQELFKLMYEWKDCYTELNSDYQIAIVANDLLEELEVPEDVESWIRTEVPDGPVVKFLNGDPDARARSSNIPDLPDFVSQWFWKVVNSGLNYGW